MRSYSSAVLAFQLRPDVLRHELIEHHSQRLVGLCLVALASGVASSGNLAKQPLCLSAWQR